MWKMYMQSSVKMMLILAFVSLQISLPLSGEPIRPEDAKKHAGEVMEVRGEVKGFTTGGGTTYINLGDAYLKDPIQKVEFPPGWLGAIGWGMSS